MIALKRVFKHAVFERAQCYAKRLEKREWKAHVETERMLRTLPVEENVWQVLVHRAILR